MRKLLRFNVPPDALQIRACVLVNNSTGNKRQTQLTRLGLACTRIERRFAQTRVLLPKRQTVTTSPPLSLSPPPLPLRLGKSRLPPKSRRTHDGVDAQEGNPHSGMAAGPAAAVGDQHYVRPADLHLLRLFPPPLPPPWRHATAPRRSCSSASVWHCAAAAAAAVLHCTKDGDQGGIDACRRAPPSVIKHVRKRHSSIATLRIKHLPSAIARDGIYVCTSTHPNKTITTTTATTQASTLPSIPPPPPPRESMHILRAYRRLHP